MFYEKIESLESTDLVKPVPMLSLEDQKVSVSNAAKRFVDLMGDKKTSRNSDTLTYLKGNSCMVYHYDKYDDKSVITHTEKISGTNGKMITQLVYYGATKIWTYERNILNDNKITNVVKKSISANSDDANDHIELRIYLESFCGQIS